MPKTVEIPNIGSVSYPDYWTQDQIQTHVTGLLSSRKGGFGNLREAEQSIPVPSREEQLESVRQFQGKSPADFYNPLSSTLIEPAIGNAGMQDVVGSAVEGLMSAGGRALGALGILTEDAKRTPESEALALEASRDPMSGYVWDPRTGGYIFDPNSVRTVGSQEQIDSARTRYVNELASRQAENPLIGFARESERQAEGFTGGTPERAASIPGQLGQVASSIGTAMVPVAGVPAMALGQGFDEAEQAIAAGRPDTAGAVAMAGTGSSAITEGALGVGGRAIKAIAQSRAGQRIADPLDRLTERLIQNPSTRQVASGAIREGIQEPAEQLFLNEAARETYDPNRPLTQDLGTSAVLGALGGAGFGGVSEISLAQAKMAASSDAARRVGLAMKEMIDATDLQINPPPARVEPAQAAQEIQRSTGVTIDLPLASAAASVANIENLQRFYSQRTAKLAATEQALSESIAADDQFNLVDMARRLPRAQPVQTDQGLIESVQPDQFSNITTLGREMPRAQMVQTDQGLSESVPGETGFNIATMGRELPAQQPTKQDQPSRTEEYIASVLPTLEYIYEPGTQAYNEALVRGLPVKAPQNSLKEISESDSVYHQTGLGSAAEIYKYLGKQLHRAWSRFFVSNNIDLALSQKGNDVILELDPSRLNGFKNQKIGTGGSVGSEFLVDKSVAGSVKSVIFKNQKVLDKFRQQFPNSLRYDLAEPVDAGIVSGKGIRVPSKRFATNQQPQIPDAIQIPEAAQVGQRDEAAVRQSVEQEVQRQAPTQAQVARTPNILGTSVQDVAADLLVRLTSTATGTKNFYTQILKLGDEIAAITDPTEREAQISDLNDAIEFARKNGGRRVDKLGEIKNQLAQKLASKSTETEIQNAAFDQILEQSFAAAQGPVFLSNEDLETQGGLNEFLKNNARGMSSQNATATRVQGIFKVGNTVFIAPIHISGSSKAARVGDFSKPGTNASVPIEQVAQAGGALLGVLRTKDAGRFLPKFQFSEEEILGPDGLIEKLSARQQEVVAQQEVDEEATGEQKVTSVDDAAEVSDLARSAGALVERVTESIVGKEGEVAEEVVADLFEDPDYRAALGPILIGLQKSGSIKNRSNAIAALIDLIDSIAPKVSEIYRKEKGDKFGAARDATAKLLGIDSIVSEEELRTAFLNAEAPGVSENPKPLMETTLRVALAAIANDPSVTGNPIRQLLIKKITDAGLLDVPIRVVERATLNKGDKNGFVQGRFNPKDGFIDIANDAADLSWTLIHEAAHAALAAAYNNDARFKAGVDLLLDIARKEFPNSREYGLANGQEFIAEAWSNPEFQKTLKDTKVKGGTLWQRFMDLVRYVFSIDRNALDELINMSTPLIGKTYEMGPDGSALNAVSPIAAFTNQKSAQEILSNTDIPEEQRSGVAREAAAQSGIISTESRRVLDSLSASKAVDPADLANKTRAEREEIYNNASAAKVAERILTPVLNIAKLNQLQFLGDTLANLYGGTSSVDAMVQAAESGDATEARKASLMAQGIMEQADTVYTLRDELAGDYQSKTVDDSEYGKRLREAVDQFQDAIERIPEASAEEIEARAAQTLIDDLVSSYKEYQENLALASGDKSIDQNINEGIQKLSDILSDNRSREAAAVRQLIQRIATDPSITKAELDGFNSSADLYRFLLNNGSLAKIVADPAFAKSTAVRSLMAEGPANGLPPMFASDSTLRKIRLINRLINDKAAVESEIKQFQNEFRGYSSKRKIPLQQFAKAYVSLNDKLQNSKDLIGEIASDFKRADIKLRGTILAGEIADSITKDPVFRASVAKAAEINNRLYRDIVFTPAEEVAGSDPVTGKKLRALQPNEVQIRLPDGSDTRYSISLSQGDRRNSVLQLEYAKRKIEEYLQGAEEAGDNPVKIRSYAHFLENEIIPRLDMLQDIESSTLSMGYLGRLGRWARTQLKGIFQSTASVADILGPIGTELSRAASAKATMEQALRDVNEKFSVKLDEARDKALESHGMTTSGYKKLGIRPKSWFSGMSFAKIEEVDRARAVEEYSREILNPILGSMQSDRGVQYKVGDTVAGTNQKVTEADLRYAMLQHEFSSELRRIAEDATIGDKELFRKAVQINDEITFGSTGGRTARASVKTGPATMAKIASENERAILREWQKIVQTAPAVGVQPASVDEAATRALRLVQLQATDPSGEPVARDIFRFVVIGYIDAQTPELSVRQNSPMQQAYYALAKAMRAGEVKIQNFDQLVEWLGNYRKNGIAKDESVEQAQYEARRILMGELETVMRNYGDTLGGASQYGELGGNQMETRSPFTESRKSLVAPYSLYNLTLSNDTSRLMLGQSLLTEFDKEILRNALRAKAVLDDYVAKSNEDIRAMGADKFFASENKENDAGKLLATFSEVENSLLPNLNALIDAYKSRILPGPEGEMQQRAMLDFVTTFGVLPLISLPFSPKVSLANILSSYLIQNPLLNFRLYGLMSSKAYSGAMKSYATGAAVLSKIALQASRAALKKIGINVNMTALQRNMFTKNIVSLLQKLDGQNMDALRSLIKSDMTLSKQIELLRRSRRLNGIALNANQLETMGAFNRGANRALTNRFTAWLPALIRRGVGAVEEQANLGLVFDSSRRLNDLKLTARDAFAIRDRNGKLVADPTNPEYFLTPEELGMDRRNITFWRQLFLPTGQPMDRLLLEFYNKTKGMTAEEAAEVPLTEGAAGDQAVVLEMLKQVNFLTSDRKALDSMNRSKQGIVQPALMLMNFMLSNIESLAGQFYSNQKRGSGKVKFIKRELGALVAMMMVFILSVLGGSIINESRNTVDEFAYGQQPSRRTIGNVINSKDSGAMMDYLSQSIASTIPVFGATIASWTGNHPSGGSAFDLANTLVLAGLLKDTYSMGRDFISSGFAPEPVVDYMRRRVPVLGAAVNRLDSGDAAARDAARALRANAPEGTLRQSSGDRGALSPTAVASRRLVSAAFSGDPGAVRSAYDAAVESQIKAGKTREEAEAVVNRSISSYDPESRVFNRRLTEDERTRLEESLTGSQRVAINRARGARDLLRLISGAGTRKSRSTAPKFLSVRPRRSRSRRSRTSRKKTVRLN